MTEAITLIIGANSEIAKALARQVAVKGDTMLIVISRNIDFYQQDIFAHSHAIKVNDYTESEISAAVNKVKEYAGQTIINRVFICHGLLHNDNCQPEKRLEDFSANAFNEIVSVNAISPMLWLKHLTPSLSGKADCKMVFFTARVASITDNNLGGWYSYRASKAALNMLLKSAAVELRRRAKNIKLISFHPGTTDSPLSKPFQRNVPEGKLFTSEFVANQLLDITKQAAVDGELSFLDWQGKNIPW